MKIIGTLIIILCIAGDVAIGIFFWNFNKETLTGLLGKETPVAPTETVSMNAKKAEVTPKPSVQVPSDWKERVYSYLGLSFKVPATFEAGDPASQDGMVASFFPSKNADSFKPVYMLYATDNVTNPWSNSTGEFEVAARAEVEVDKTAVYQESNLWKDVSGATIYSITFTQKNDDGLLLKFKRVIIFHEGKEFEIFVVDDPKSFAESERVFDTIISSLKLF